MWRMVLRDLQWRRRRFVLAGLATTLVFAMALVLSGISAAVHNEGVRTVERFDADAWFIGNARTNPFISPPLITPEITAEIAALPGVERADPVLLMLSTLEAEPPQAVNVTGLSPGSSGWPDVSTGVSEAQPGQVVLSPELGYEVGDEVGFAGTKLLVVGVAPKTAHNFGTPTMFLTLEDMQRMTIGGAPLASAVVVHGTPTATPADAAQVDDERLITDLGRPLAQGTSTIDYIRYLLLLTAAGIVGLIVYLSTLERTADIAVLRATGGTRGFVAAGLTVQALLLSIASAILSIGLSNLLGPTVPLALELSTGAYLELLVVAIVVGGLASLLGVWRAVRTDPAVAFGGR